MGRVDRSRGDRDDSRRSARQQRPRQPARTWANFDHIAAFEVARRAHDSRREITVQKEMLTQGMPGAQSVRRDHVAQRRRT